MPRKFRTPKTRIAALPSPAWTYWLLTGGHEHRILGWVAMLQGMYADVYGVPDADEIWSLHGEALREEARAAGFEPWWVTKQKPTGEAFERWRAAFVQEHRY